MTWIAQAAAAVVGVLVAGLLVALALRLSGRALVRLVLARFTRRLFTDPYHENLWETVTGVRRFGAQAVVETELRAASGEMIMRPFGRFKPFPGFDALLLDPAQLHRLPTPEHVSVDMSVILGPRAVRPLRIEIPVLITGMGYGVALSPQAKKALARGTARAGTATSTGMGPLLPAERREARSLIIQYNRGEWGNPPETLRQADAIEIQLGSGAWAGSGFRVLTHNFTPETRRAFGLRPGQQGSLVHNRMPGMETAADLTTLVAELRAMGGGVPIGLKLAAGDHLESDLEVAVRAGVDYVQVDGAEGGIHQSAPTLADDFGLPTFFALCRAHRFMATLDPEERPSLVVSGGLYTPGHFLKALALGADAVAIGTAALFALGHNQTSKAVPWEPPLDLVLYGRPAARRLDVEKAAESLSRYLSSAEEELALAVRALGKTRLAEVNRDDLLTMEPWVADVAGVHLAWARREAAARARWGHLNRTLERQVSVLSSGRDTLLQVLEVLSPRP